MTHRSRSSLAVLALGIGLTGSLLVTSPDARADDADDGRMILLLDSSGSMKDPAQGGMTKIDAAKKSLTSVISELPVDAQVGLRVFGATVENKNDKGACQDSQLVVPMGTNNKAALQAAVSTHKPYGETPIGYALEEAAKDLGDKGKRSIVLVSDGEATCEPDPCAAAEKIAAKGVDISINVVGLGVDDKTRKQLQCIAGKGKGKYYDAKNADQLSDALEKSQAQSIRPTGYMGKKVAGTPTAVGAPSIQVGDYVDSLGAPGTDAGTRYYQLHRTIPHSTIAASALLEPVMGHNDSLKIELIAGSTTCSSQTGSGSSDGSSTTLTAAAQVPQYSGDDACDTSTDLLMRVSRDGTDADTAVRPLQLRVTEVPPVTNLADLPEPPNNYDIAVPTLAAGKTLVGGNQLANAAAVESGVTYETNVKTGEIQTYKMPVGWGQTMGVKVQIPKPSASLAKTYKNNKMWLTTKLLDPTGNMITKDTTTLADWDSSPSLTMVNVNFKRVHRYTSNSAWLAGNYTLVVTVRGATNGPKVSVPYRFVASVDEPVQGVPVYAKKGEVAPSSQSAAPEATASESASAETSTEPTEEPTESATAEATSTESTEATSASEEKKDGNVMPALLGLAGLALVAGGVTVALRRRRAASAAPTTGGHPNATNGSGQYPTTWPPASGSQGATSTGPAAPGDPNQGGQPGAKAQPGNQQTPPPNPWSAKDDA
ncbi:VWA domain-containing protein [Luteococcus sp. H138]|uniref:vWA domain-containing protein n=1 Tax=unclassified Luteococcus TaxID=2639923 RepID=UPI00313C9A63